MKNLGWLYLPLICIVVYIFAFNFPVAMDLPNHLARAHILDVCLSSNPPALCQNFSTKFEAISYFFSDYSLLLLLRISPNEFIAGKIALFLILALNLFGWHYLFGKVRPELNSAYLAGLLLLLNNFYYKGFYAYILGNGALLFWLGFWWPRRDQRNFKVALQLSLGLLLLYFFHLAAFFTAVACFCAYAFWSFVCATGSDRREIFLSYFRTWPFILSFIFLYGFQQYQTGPTILNPVGAQGLDAGTGWLLWWKVKLVRLLYVTINHSKYFDSLVAGLSLLALALCIKKRRCFDRESGFWLFFTAALIAVYIITPDISHGGADVDLRFLLPAYYTLILWFGASIEDSKLARAAVTILLCMHLAINFYYKVGMDRDLGALSEALAKVPPGYKLVELNSQFSYPQSGLSRVNPFSHFASLYMLHGGLLTQGLLNCYMNPNIPYFCYSDPARSTSTFKNQFQGLPALDSQEIKQISENYDYILVIEPKAELVKSKLPADSFEQIHNHQDVYVFKSKVSKS